MSTINNPSNTMIAQSSDTILPVRQAVKFEKSTIPTEHIVSRLKFALDLPPADDLVRVVVYADVVRAMLGRFRNDEYLQEFVRWLRSDISVYGG